MLDDAEYAVEQAKARCPDLNIRPHDLKVPLPVDNQYAGSVMLHQVIEHIDPGTADFVLQEFCFDSIEQVFEFFSIPENLG